MSKYFNKALSLFLAAVFLLSTMGSLSACNKDGGSKPKTKKTDVSGGEEPDENLGPSPTPEPINDSDYEEVVYEPPREKEITADEEAGVAVELPPGSDSRAELKVTEIEAPKPLYDAEMKVFDIDLEDFRSGSSFFDIRLPYGDLGLKGEAEGNIGAAYYNPESEEWEPVLFRLDEAKQEVVIKSNHFSIYSCFNIENSGKRQAFVCYVTTSGLSDDYFYDDERLSEVLETMVHYGKNEGKPDKALIDKGLEYVDEASTYLGNLLTVGSLKAEIFQEYGLAYDLEKVSKWLSDFTTVFGISVLTYHTWQNAMNDGLLTTEENQALATEAYKLLLSCATGAAVSTMGGVVLMFQPVVENALKGFQERVVRNEKNAYRRGYYIYYDEVNSRSAEDWADFLEKARDGALDNDRLQLRIEGEVKRYSEAVWREPDSVWLRCIGDADLSHRFGGYWRLASLSRTKLTDKIKDEISQEYQKELMATMIPQAVTIVRERDYWRARKLMLDKLKVLEDYLNTEHYVSFYDEAFNEESGEASALAGAKVYIVKDSESGLRDDWMLTLDEQGRGKIRFRLIGWLQSDFPQHVKVFGKDDDPATAEPILETDFLLEETELKVPLRLGPELPKYPTLEEITFRDFWGFDFLCTRFMSRMGDDVTYFTYPSQVEGKTGKFKIEVIEGESRYNVKVSCQEWYVEGYGNYYPGLGQLVVDYVYKTEYPYPSGGNANDGMTRSIHAEIQLTCTDETFNTKNGIMRDIRAEGTCAQAITERRKDIITGDISWNIYNIEGTISGIRH